MNSLEELGKKAYQKQMWGDYEGAIKIYNTAVKKFPKDPRLLNNRCCCYMELKDYKKALEDADLMINIFPTYIKSYYRKGETLAALKRYVEAELLFRAVLSMDSECVDARRQLQDVQLMQLCQYGYEKEKALKALGLTISNPSQIPNVDDAHKVLKLENIDAFYCNDVNFDDVYYSDDENTSSNIIKQSSGKYDPFTDPANPLKSSSLWVGNITEAVTEKMLKEKFSKFGRIINICVHYSNFCAFINYGNVAGPGKAMKALQGSILGGKNILIRYPNSAANNRQTKAI